MAKLSTVNAAALLGVSASHLKTFARATGITPDRRSSDRIGRGHRLMWGARHLLAVMMATPLRRLGVRDADAVVFIRGIADLPSDEVLEAVVRDRPFALVVAPFLCPHMLDAAAVRAAGETGGAELMLQGRQLTAIHLGDLYADLIGRMRTAAGVQDATR